LQDTGIMLPGSFRHLRWAILLHSEKRTITDTILTL